MGSKGTGNFGDYNKSGSTGSSKGGGGQGQGGSGGVKGNECEKAIGDISLEDVANCSYFKKYKKVPPPDTQILLSEKLEGGRLTIITEQEEVIGYIPTKFNYLRRCIQDGYKYSGQVNQSNIKPIPTVRIDLSPT